MTQPKVIVGKVPDKLLVHIVEHALADKLGADVIARDVELFDLEEMAIANGANIIVLELNEHDLPPICERLLDKLDKAVLVGLRSDIPSESGARKTRIAVFHSGDLEPDELADTILTAMQKSLKRNGSLKRV